MQIVSFCQDSEAQNPSQWFLHTPQKCFLFFFVVGETSDSFNMGSNLNTLDFSNLKQARVMTLTLHVLS